MAQRGQTKQATWALLSALLATGVCGLAACSSGGESPAMNNNAVDGTDAASISCNSDPRTEALAPNLTHKGANGLSFVIVSADHVPLTMGNSTWTVKVLDAAGQPAAGAVLSFPKGSHPSNPWMPDHGHGALPARSSTNADGTFTVTPLDFFMSGVWSTLIQAKVGDVTDSTTFTFCVDG
jgi:hypothetical protein